jgi:hypothetical protein
MVAHGVEPVTTAQYLYEMQRDWARKDTYDAVMGIVHDHQPRFGVGVQYFKTLTGAPQAEGGTVPPKKVPEPA